jgi:hypothetical protein
MVAWIRAGSCKFCRTESRPRLLRYTVIMRLRHVLAAFTLMAGLAFGQEVPRPAGEFAIGMNNGSQVLLSQYSGKVILLAFLYTT